MTNLVVLERGEPIPVAKTFSVQAKTCHLPDLATSTHSFSMEEEDEDTDSIDIQSMTSDDITSAIDAIVPDGYTGARRLEASESDEL